MSNKFFFGSVAVVFALITGLSVFGYGMLRNSKEQLSVREREQKYVQSQEQFKSMLQELEHLRPESERLKKGWDQEKEFRRNDNASFAKKNAEDKAAFDQKFAESEEKRLYAVKTFSGFIPEQRNMADRMQAAVDRASKGPETIVITPPTNSQPEVIVIPMSVEKKVVTPSLEQE